MFAATPTASDLNWETGARAICGIRQTAAVPTYTPTYAPLCGAGQSHVLWAWSITETAGFRTTPNRLLWQQLSSADGPI